MTTNAKIHRIRESCAKLQSYIENEKYRGYDPYDALLSPLFALPLFNKNKILRFGIQQLVKRSPVNLRSLLQIKKGLNPVTLGLCIQSYTSLAEAKIISAEEAIEKCNSLLSSLDNMIAPGYHGACWGYDFPWESRHMKIPAFQPTIVATGIITNALFTYYNYSGNLKAIELCKSACDFILHDIHQTTDPDGSICFSYSPFDTIRVLNASMKGIRTLSQVFNITHDSVLSEISSKAIKFVMKQQNSDGSWDYAIGKHGQWIDNYHTGYVLDCLDEYIKHTNDFSWEQQLKKGFDFYLNNFFEEGHIPKFFNNSKYVFKAAKTLGVSSFAFLVRALNLNLISPSSYHNLKRQADIDYQAFLKKEAEKKAAQKLKQKENPGGPNPYLLKLNKNSRLFTQVVLDSLRSGFVQPTQASLLLGIPVNNLHKLEAQIYR